MSRHFETPSDRAKAASDVLSLRVSSGKERPHPSAKFLVASLQARGTESKHWKIVLGKYGPLHSESNVPRLQPQAKTDIEKGSEQT